MGSCLLKDNDVVWKLLPWNIINVTFAAFLFFSWLDQSSFNKPISMDSVSDIQSRVKESNDGGKSARRYVETSMRVS